MNIKKKFTVIFLLISIVPMLLVGALILSNAENSLKKETLTGLNIRAEAKELEVLFFLEAKRFRTEDFASDGFIRDEAERISGIENFEELKLESESLDNHLRVNKKPLDEDILEIHVIDLKGRIIGTTEHHEVGGDQDKNQPFFLKGIKETYVQDAHQYIHEGVEEGVVAVGTPLKSRTSGEVIGVLMNRYSLGYIRDLLLGAKSLDIGSQAVLKMDPKSMDAYIVNQDGIMLTQSIKMADYGFLQHKMSTEPISRCIDAGEEINGEWLDFRGDKILGASMCMQPEKDWKWVLVVEQYESAALAPIKKLEDMSIMIGAVFVFLVFFVALFTARSISKPIHTLEEGVKIIGKGDLEYTVGINSDDEIGSLSRAFDQMTKDLKIVTASRDELDKEIDERKKAEEVLRESETRLKDAHRIAHIGNWAWDLQTNELYWSEENYRIFGLSKDVVPSYEAFEKTIHPEDLEFVNKSVEDALQRKKPYDIEFRIIIPGGEERVVHAIGKVNFDKADKPLRFFGTIQDITERKKAEEMLTESEEKFRGVVESS
ncbi:MAG: PAS domain-containing protein, partial [Candidatus Hydrothermarchaeales archaeon]